MSYLCRPDGRSWTWSTTWASHIGPPPPKSVIAQPAGHFRRGQSRGRACAAENRCGVWRSGRGFACRHLSQSRAAVDRVSAVVRAGAFRSRSGHCPGRRLHDAIDQSRNDDQHLPQRTWGQPATWQGGAKDMIDILDPWTPRCGFSWPRPLFAARWFSASGNSDLPGVFCGMLLVAERAVATMSTRN